MVSGKKFGSSALAKVLSVIQQPYFTVKVLIITLVLCSPGLFVDIYADDYLHYAAFNQSLPL